MRLFYGKLKNTPREIAPTDYLLEAHKDDAEVAIAFNDGDQRFIFVLDDEDIELLAACVKQDNKQMVHQSFIKD